MNEQTKLRLLIDKTAIDMAQALYAQLMLGKAHILMDHAATYFSQSGVHATLPHLQQAYKESKRHAEKSN